MITTENRAWGFFGTLATAGVANAGELFDAAARALTVQLGLTADEARTALDAKIGRHMADQRMAGEAPATLIARLIQQGSAKDIRRAAGQPEPKRAKPILLRVKRDEASMLRYALDHALASISEAPAEDRAQLKALIARLEASEKAARA